MDGTTGAPCNCIDLSKEETATANSGCSSAGVFLGANLAFSQSNFAENNNLSPSSPVAEKPELKGNTIGSFLKWRHNKDANGLGAGTGTTGTSPDVEPGQASGAEDIMRDLRKREQDSQQSWSLLVEGGAEFLATAILMFFGCGGSYIEGDKPASVPMGSLAFGCAVFMATSIFGDVSGAHMNPLVTLLNVAVAGMRWTRALAYLTFQAAGAFVGFGLLLVVVPPSVRSAVEGATPSGCVCTTVPYDDMPMYAVVVAEFLVTSLLLSACCAGMARGEQPSLAAFRFGVLVAAICYVEAPYTGASMNPTRSIAVAVWSGVWDGFWAYMVGQALAITTVVTVFLLLRKRKGD